MNINEYFKWKVMHSSMSQIPGLPQLVHYMRGSQPNFWASSNRRQWQTAAMPPSRGEGWYWSGQNMKSTPKRPPLHGFGKHLQHPAPNPNGPACCKRTGKQYQGHLLTHAPAPKVLGCSWVCAWPFPHSKRTWEGMVNQGNQPSSLPVTRHILLQVFPVQFFPDARQHVGQPLQWKSWGLIQRRVFPLIVWGIHLSWIFVPIGIHHGHTTATNNNSIIYKPLGYSLYTLQITLHSVEWSLNKVKTNAVHGNQCRGIQLYLVIERNSSM